MGTAPLLPTQAECEREREVLPFHPLSLDIPVLDALPHSLPPPSHRPRPSSNAVLTAIAQLAALRLGARRALISLIDSRSQIVLAEATPTLPLCPGRAVSDSSSYDGLWLGCATIPRECGLCELVLGAGGSAVVINDLQHDTRSAAHSLLKHTPSPRFYASVPLVAQTGSIIGAVAVFDDAPRSGLAPQLVRALHDVAAAAMSYLNASRALDDNCRAERLVRGLTSFVSGADDLQHHANLNVPRSPPNPTALSPLPHPSNVPVLERPVVSRNASTELHPPAAARISPPIDHEPPSETRDELPALQNMILPPGAKRMFSRAATIMRASGGFSGVIIFDASLANPGVASTPPLGSPDSTADDDGPASCKILGFADGDASSRTGTSPKSDYLTLAESDLKHLLNQNPHGKIFTFPPPASSAAGSSSDDGSAARREEKSTRCQGRRRKFSAAAAIMDVAQDARSAAVVPLWDYQRQRWLAGCLCWTTDPRRLLSHAGDLLYLRTFGNSVMTELSRLDALSVDRAKSTFIESMSHELRSPLHGILGGIEYLRGTELDAAQSSIVASIGVCGRTLLDTVRNVLEYSKINDNLGSSPWRRHHAVSAASTPTADVRQLTEETVEAVFAGHSYSVSSTQAEEGDEPFMRVAGQDMPSSPTGAPVRRAIRIILDMPENRPWHLALQPAIWRRIVMNVFGNALKFTHTGFIRVSLSATDVDESETNISLTVADSGTGMSPQFLSDGLFKAFSQENPFVPGTGLGMSIVHRLVDSLGGSISVQSQQNVGTEIRITATLRKRICRGENVISAIAARLRGRRICIPDGFMSNNHAAPAAVLHGERYFVESITQSLSECFGVHVGTDVDPDNDQLVVYPGPNMTCMSKSRPHKAMSVIVALDALEAATLRTDARIAGGCVEVVTQPCGPYKLARILERYLNRCQVAVSQPSQTSVLPLGHPRPNTTTTTDPARPPQPPWPLSRLPTFRPSTPTTTPDPLSPPRRASIPHLSSSTDSVPRQRQRHHHPPSSFPPKPRSRSASTASIRHHRKAEILIVDDNPLNVRLLSAFLTKHGFPDHVAAPNGLEAVRLFKAEPRRWAAILMDLSMPVMDGATATREIRAWEKHLAARARKGGGGGGGGGGGMVDGAHRQREVEGRNEKVEAEERDSSAAAAAASPSGGELDRQQHPAPSTQPNGIAVQKPDVDAGAGVQIIVTTGLGSATARFEALSAGADEYMTKPIQFGTLMKMLNKRIEDRAAAAPAG